MPEGKTVTIQHLSSEQAQQTATDTQLPDTSGGGGIGAWISQHRLMLMIVGGGAILGIIIYFYIKNQQQSTLDAATTDTGASTDGTTTSPGSSSGAPDFSPIENLLNQLQQSSDLTNQELSALQASESSESGTPSSGKCPSGMHMNKNGHCKCNKPNMINKGDHCEPKKGSKGGAEDMHFALGGSDMYNDMFNVRSDNPWRNNGHRMMYALGGSEVTYHGTPMEAKGRRVNLTSPPPHYKNISGFRQIDPWQSRHGRFGGSRIMPPIEAGNKYHHW